jgi:FAD/FMN-containing dehydrogenase
MTSEDVFPGGRVDDRDSRYPTLVRGFNLRWVGEPRYVELCGSAEQVRAAVQRALDDELRITIQGGGHCYENFAVGNDGGVILDLSAMNAIGRDPETGWYCIEGGATLWDAYTRLYRLYGVTIPAGSCYAVGAGGHIVGGGYGLLSRLHGLTVDVLHAVEVVVVRNGRAEIVTVSRDSTDPDEQLLMWGHLGAGGGNFGVVTKYFFRDPPRAPMLAHLLTMAWNWDDLSESAFAALVGNYGTFLAANSDPGSPYAGMFALLHLFQRKAKQITLTVQYVGDRPQLLGDFAGEMGAGLPPAAVPHAAHPVLGAPPPASDSVRCLPWLYATQTLNGIGANQRGKYKSAYMNKPFPDDQIEVMWDALGNPANPNPQALLQVDSYGCEINTVPSDATAVPQRSSIMKLQYQTYWTRDADDGANLDWIRGFYDAMYGPDGPKPDPDGVMDGCYVNYPDVDLADWQDLYYQAGYPKLQQVKQAWDPGDVFNHAQSVELPGEA